MTKELWINLPVKDLKKSKEFFTKIGFLFNDGFGNTDESACLVIGNKKIIVMLFSESQFKSFTRNNIADTKLSTEVLFSIDAESKQEVDEMAKKAVEAGGTLFAPPGGDGWMYGCGFADPDGHRWNVLFMDRSKMPNKK